MSKFDNGQKFHILMPLGSIESYSYIDIAKRVTDMGFVRFQVGDITYSVADQIDATAEQKD